MGRMILANPKAVKPHIVVERIGLEKMKNGQDKANVRKLVRTDPTCKFAKSKG